MNRIGLHTVGFWVVSAMALVSAGSSLSEELPRPELIKLPFAFWDAMENTPAIYDGRPLLLLNYRDDRTLTPCDYAETVYLYIINLRTGQRIAEFGKGYNFVSGLVDGKRLHVFASKLIGSPGARTTKSIHHFWSDDLKTWKQEVAIEQKADEDAMWANSSVCRDDQGYVMVYDTGHPYHFCFKFARSKDLSRWERLPGLVFGGRGKEYAGCPVIRYFKPYYYVIYLGKSIPGRGHSYSSFVARSKDLVVWQLRPEPMLEPGPGEGINVSDVGLFEFKGNTYLFYNTGTQSAPPKGWSALRVAVYLGPMKQFFESWFPEGAKMVEVTTRWPRPSSNPPR